MTVINTKQEEIDRWRHECTSKDREIVELK